MLVKKEEGLRKETEDEYWTITEVARLIKFEKA
jgi:hypothetical protein